MFRTLPLGKREEKFKALAAIRLKSEGWIECPSEWRSPFLPASTGAWAKYAALEDFFVYNGSGVQTKRTWVIAPDSETLAARWQSLINEADPARKEVLFHATLRNGEPADRHIRSVVKEAIPGYEAILKPIIDETGPCRAPVRYGFRSFNRQWIIPDARVITQPNAVLWESSSDHQVYLTAPSDRSPTNGPALTLTALIPDLHHYNGRGGRVFPLRDNKEASKHNLRPNLLPFLAGKYARPVTAEDLLAYIAGIAAHPGYTSRFQNDLSTPGLRIPLTADAQLFFKASKLGRKVI
jgi:predicted helicase